MKRQELSSISISRRPVRVSERIILRGRQHLLGFLWTTVTVKQLSTGNSGVLDFIQVNLGTDKV